MQRNEKYMNENLTRKISKHSLDLRGKVGVKKLKSSMGGTGQTGHSE